MFNLTNWIKNGIIEGFESGEFSLPKITELTANYLIKGIFTEADAEEIANATAKTAQDDETIESSQQS